MHVCCRHLQNDHSHGVHPSYIRQRLSMLRASRSNASTCSAGVCCLAIPRRVPLRGRLLPFAAVGASFSDRSAGPAAISGRARSGSRPLSFCTKRRSTAAAAASRAASCRIVALPDVPATPGLGGESPARPVGDCGGGMLAPVSTAAALIVSDRAAVPILMPAAVDGNFGALLTVAGGETSWDELGGVAVPVEPCCDPDTPEKTAPAPPPLPLLPRPAAEPVASAASAETLPSFAPRAAAHEKHGHKLCKVESSTAAVPSIHVDAAARPQVALGIQLHATDRFRAAHASHLHPERCGCPGWQSPAAMTSLPAMAAPPGTPARRPRPPPWRVPFMCAMSPVGGCHWHGSKGAVMTEPWLLGSRCCHCSV